MTRNQGSRSEVDLTPLIALLAELCLADRPAGAVCFTCRRVLAARVRNCPHCRAEREAS